MRRFLLACVALAALLLSLPPGSRALSSGVAYTDIANIFTANQRINAGLGVNVAPGSTGTISASGSIFEQSRSVALGDFTSFTPTMTSLNAVSVVDGTWTVGSGSVNCRYALVGPHLAMIALDFENTSISSGTATTLRVSTPLTFGIETNSVAAWFRSSWTFDALVQARSGTSNIDITRAGAATWGSGVFFMRYVAWVITQ